MLPFDRRTGGYIVNQRITEEKYRVRYYELTRDWKASISSVIDYFNDVVTLQSVEVGDGVEAMRFSGFAWLLLRWEVDIYRLPDFMENLVVRTIPYSMNKFYAYRTFEAIDEAGKLLVHARSQWILADIHKRRPVRIGSRHYDVYGLSRDSNNELSFENLIEPERVDIRADLTVRRSDLDTNGHTNNVSYIRWIMQTIPNSYDESTLAKFCINYKHESMEGDLINIDSYFESSSASNNGYHRVSSSGQTLVIAKTTWR